MLDARDLGGCFKKFTMRRIFLIILFRGINTRRVIIALCRFLTFRVILFTRFETSWLFMFRETLYWNRICIFDSSLIVSQSENSC